MKFPKNREHCYIAMRDLFESNGKLDSSTPCGVFAFVDDCENFCASCEQEWRDKGANVAFRPQLSTFYG
jgi:hypothetical protein